MARKKTTEVVEPVASPSLSEFSDQAASKAINKKIFGSPWTVYPIVLGLAVGVGGALIAVPVVAIAGLAGLAVGAGHVVVKCAQSGRMRDELYAEFQKKKKEAEEAERLSIRSELRKYLKVAGLSEEVGQAIAQFDHVERTMQDMKEVLDARLNRGELSYSMLDTVAEQADDGILDNLRSITLLLKDIRSVDLPYVETRLDTLRRRGEASLSDSQREELNAMQERAAFYESQHNEISRRLAVNETAITALEKVTSEIARMQNGGQDAELKFRITLEQLRQFHETSKDFHS